LFLGRSVPTSPSQTHSFSLPRPSLQHNWAPPHFWYCQNHHHFTQGFLSPLRSSLLEKTTMSQVCHRLLVLYTTTSLIICCFFLFTKDGDKPIIIFLLFLVAQKITINFDSQSSYVPLSSTLASCKQWQQACSLLSSFKKKIKPLFWVFVNFQGTTLRSSLYLHICGFSEWSQALCCT
jgi:hypothetical protein